MTRRSERNVGESEHLNMTDEAGEPSRGTLRRKGRCREGEPLMGKTNDLSQSASVLTKQQRIAELARNARDMAMDLSHYMDRDWLLVLHPHERGRL